MNGASEQVVVLLSALAVDFHFFNSQTIMSESKS